MTTPVAEYVQAQAYDETGKPLAMEHIADDVAAGRARFVKGVRIYAKAPSGKLVTVLPEDAASPGYTVLTPAQLHAEYVARHGDQRATGVDGNAHEGTDEPGWIATPTGAPFGVAEFIGIALGALLWPWLIGKVLAIAGVQRNSAIWSGYFLAVLVGAGIAGVTGWPPASVGIFALFGLGWSLWRARSNTPKVASEPEPAEPHEDNDEDDPALVALIDDIESKKAGPIVGSGGLRPQPKDPIPSSPRAEPALAASTADAQRRCGACGETNDSDAGHCIGCGKSLRDLRCNGCSQLNVAKARFCKRCGGPLE